MVIKEIQWRCLVEAEPAEDTNKQTDKNKQRAWTCVQGARTTNSKRKIRRRENAMRKNEKTKQTKENDKEKSRRRDADSISIKERRTKKKKRASVTRRWWDTHIPSSSSSSTTTTSWWWIRSNQHKTGEEKKERRTKAQQTKEEAKRSRTKTVNKNTRQWNSIIILTVGHSFACSCFRSDCNDWIKSSRCLILDTESFILRLNFSAWSLIASSYSFLVVIRSCSRWWRESFSVSTCCNAWAAALLPLARSISISWIRFFLFSISASNELILSDNSFILVAVLFALSSHTVSLILVIWSRLLQFESLMFV